MKEQLNEHFATNFVKKVFMSIVSQRNAALEKAAKQDPEFKRIIRQADEAKRDLEKWVQKKRSEDPDFKDTYDFVNQMY